MSEPMFHEEGYNNNQLIPASAWELEKNRTIYLEGEITAEMAMDFRKKLHYLEARQEPGQAVKVVIDSPGGSVTDGLAIYDAMQGTSLVLDLICFGAAYSMAAVLLAGGKKGHRFITKHSYVMIHEPRAQAGGGTVSSIEAQAQLGKRFKDVVNGILAENTGHTLEEIEKVTGSDTYMNAQEAVAFGIADEAI